MTGLRDWVLIKKGSKGGKRKAGCVEIEAEKEIPDAFKSSATQRSPTISSPRANNSSPFIPEPWEFGACLVLIPAVTRTRFLCS